MNTAETPAAASVPVDDAPGALLFCQQCGYDLRGLTSDRCPECGHDLGNLRSPDTLIPWARRGELGWFRGYWLTVFWVSLKYKQFCEEVVRDVSYHDAQRFRWTTVGMVYLGVLEATVAWYVGNWPKLFSNNAANAAFQALWPMAIIHMLVVLYLAAATGVPGYFFDRLDIGVRRRNSAIAMSYYTLGALAWTPLNVAIIIGVVSSIDSPPLGLGESPWAGVAMMAGALVCVAFLDWLLNIERTLRRVMPHKPHRARVAGAAILLLWILLAVILFVCAPMIGAYAYLMIQAVP